MNRRDFLTALTGAALAAPSVIGHAAQAATHPARRWTAVQRMIDRYVAERKVAGAAVALSYGGAALSYLTAGRIAFDSPERFDENSICRISSMTKPVTGVAAMMLVEDGRLALDQPVADVLPEFRSLRVAIDIRKSLESRPAVKTMTMRHLLTHTSGLSYWTPGSGDGALPTAYRERGITPGNTGSRLNRPGYAQDHRHLLLARRSYSLRVVNSRFSVFSKKTFPRTADAEGYRHLLEWLRTGSVILSHQ